MKFKWLISILLAFAVGVLIAFYLTQPEVKRKMTFKTPTLDIPLTNIVPSTKPAEEAQKALKKQQAQQQQATAMTPIPKPLESLNEAEERPKKKLNLALPKEWDSSDWKKPVEERHPNFFKPADGKKVNVSTKLHWDESEEAQDLPLEKMIEGVELELQIKLR